MLRLLLNLKMDKIKRCYNAHSIKAGIVFNNKGLAVDKIMFEVIDGSSVEIFSDVNFSLDMSDEFYIGNVISLEYLLKNFFNKSNFSFVELLFAYKMFLNDDSFINNHLDYFGMFVRPVGYKGKYEIAKDPCSYNLDGQNLYYDLMNIIFYESLNEEKENEFVKAK